MKAESRHRISFIITDYILTSVAWLLFNIVRYNTVDNELMYTTLSHFLIFPVVMWGQLLIPVMMLGLYWLSGFYNHTFGKSRLEVITTATSSVLIGAIFVYFAALIDDPIPDRLSNYELIVMFIIIMGGLVISGRLVITAIITRAIKHGRLCRNVIVVGNKENVADCLKKLNRYRHQMGMNVVGYTLTNCQDRNDEDRINNTEIYNWDNLSEVCKEKDVRQIVLAVKPNDADNVLQLVRRLYSLDLPVLLPAWSAGSIMARMSVRTVNGEPFTNITSVNLSPSQCNIKRLTDIVLSTLALITLLPFMLIIALLVKSDSKGTIFYSQERIGRHRVKFNIYKFRTMHEGAEDDGPALSTDNDNRITRIGHVLRKYRLDELPQFWNILKGDMSLVGPRPEREYYEEQILKIEPRYTLVHQVRPGLTSWGMVKYGYASSVDQMVERLGYDMIYMENISLLVDLKIMFHTIKTVITGQGI